MEFVLPTDPVERVQHQLNWFWYMYAPMAKRAARGDRERTRDQIEGLIRVLHEAADLVDEDPAEAPEGDVFDTVRALGHTMTGLHPLLRAAGVGVPIEVDERLRRYDQGNEIRRQVWLH